MNSETTLQSAKVTVQFNVVAYNVRCLSVLDEKFLSHLGSDYRNKLGNVSKSTFSKWQRRCLKEHCLKWYVGRGVVIGTDPYDSRASVRGDRVCDVRACVCIYLRG